MCQLTSIAMLVQVGQLAGDNLEEIQKQKAIRGFLNKITPEI